MGKYIFWHLEEDLGVVFVNVILNGEATCVGSFSMFGVKKILSYTFGVLVVFSIWIVFLLVQLIYPYP